MSTKSILKKNVEGQLFAGPPALKRAKMEKKEVSFGDNKVQTIWTNTMKNLYGNDLAAYQAETAMVKIDAHLAERQAEFEKFMASTKIYGNAAHSKSMYGGLRMIEA